MTLVRMWVLLAGSFGLARAARGAADGDSSLSGLSGAEWSAALHLLDAEYRKLLDTWRARLDQASDSDDSQLAVRLEMRAKIEGLEQRRDMLTGLRADKSEEQERLRDAATIRQGFEADYARRIGDARKAVESAKAELQRSLEAPRQARAAERALQAWWNAHVTMDWGAHFEGQPDPRAPLRQELEVLAAQLGEPTAGAVATLFRLARAEEDERRAARAAMLRQTDPGLKQVEDTLASLDAEIRRLNEQIEMARARVKQLDEAARPSHDDEVLADKTRQLAAAYGRLETSLANDASMEAASIGRDRWCALFVHQGIMAYLSGDPRGVDRLRTAVSTYGGPCHEVAYEELDVPALQVAWANALFLEGQEPAAWVLIDGDVGTWSIDGTAIEVATGTRIRLAAGAHRIAYVGAEGNSVASAIIEDFKPDDRAGVRVVNQKIVLDVIPPDSTDWVIPVRHELLPVEADVMKPAAYLWGAGAGVMALRLAGDLHLGGSARIERAILRRSRAELGAGLALDWLTSDAPYAYGRAITPALVRLRIDLGARSPEGRLRPVACLSPGVLPPAQAFSLDASGGLEFRSSDRLSIGLMVGASSSFWDGTVFWLEPVSRLAFSTSF